MGALRSRSLKVASEVTMTPAPAVQIVSSMYCRYVLCDGTLFGAVLCRPFILASFRLALPGRSLRRRTNANAMTNAKPPATVQRLKLDSLAPSANESFSLPSHSFRDKPPNGR
jgi:hypothetical protein